MIFVMRSGGVSGEINMDMDMPRSLAAANKGAAQSRSRSGIIIPSKPESASACTNFSLPRRCTMETLTMATIPIVSLARMAATSFKMAAGVAPCSSAWCIACEITGPSAMGSENGMPISTIELPAFCRLCSVSASMLGVGKPATTKGISALR